MSDSYCVAAAGCSWLGSSYAWMPVEQPGMGEATPPRLPRNCGVNATNELRVDAFLIEANPKVEF